MSQIPKRTMLQPRLAAPQAADQDLSDDEAAECDKGGAIGTHAAAAMPTPCELQAPLYHSMPCRRGIVAPPAMMQ